MSKVLVRVSKAFKKCYFKNEKKKKNTILLKYITFMFFQKNKTKCKLHSSSVKSL